MIDCKFSDEAKQQILWDHSSISNALNTSISHSFQAYGVSIDSRSIQKGDVFIALNGANFDGNDFAIKALDKGASIAIVNKELEAPYSQKTIVVKDTMHALCSLARFARAQFKGKVIGITGSVGKTTLKSMLSLALTNQGLVHSSSGNFNNHIGLPLTLARMPQSADFAILEMGMNHLNELTQLSELAKPEIAVITTVEAAHLGNFKSVASIAEAKSEIMDGMKSGSYILINTDNPYHKILTDKAHLNKLEVIGFGTHAKNPIRLDSYKFHNKISFITALIFGRKVEYLYRAFGKHTAINSVIALGLVKLIGAEVEVAATNLADFTQLKGRGQLYETSDIKIIDESYNASPVAVIAALETLGSYAGQGRSVAILGSMAELGAQSKYYHELLIDEITKNKIDKVFTVGDDIKVLYDGLNDDVKVIHVDTAQELIERIGQYIQPNDIILVKGKNVLKLEEVVEFLKSL